MGLTFRTATLAEGEEVGRVIRAAFTPYVRALGREWAEIAREVGGSAEARRKQLTRAISRVSRELGLDEQDDE